MLKHQQTIESDTSEVIRLAHQLYERDRSEQEHNSSLIAAAEEMGIPAEYMAKATEMLKSGQAQQTVRVPALGTRQRSIALVLAAFGLAIGVLMLVFLTYVRAEVSAPAVAVQASPTMEATQLHRP